MRYMVDPRQKILFDPYEHALPTPVRQKLDAGWQGVMRHVILELLPVGVLAEQRDPVLGCPTKELYSVAGLLFVMEFLDWTRAQACEQYELNLGVQYALNLAPGGVTLSVRTLGRYREMFHSDEAGSEVFDRVTQAFVKALELNVSSQRLDSTHVFSDMARFGRTQMMGVAVRRFLWQVRRHDRAAFDALPEQMRERYAPSEQHLFGDTARDQASRRALRQTVAQDMHALVRRFEDAPGHSARTSYKHLRRMFYEQCTVVEERVKVREKCGGSVMQNPSDPDATFDGKKGPGYQVQVAQTCSPDNEVQLITAALPQTAAATDPESFVPVLDTLANVGRLPGSMLADAAYGSDENVQEAGRRDVDLVSPVNPSRRDPDRLHVADFTIDPNTETVTACPAGHAPTASEHDAATGATRTCMNPDSCGQCPLRDHCPATGKHKRTFTHTAAERRCDQRLRAQQDPAWRERYAKRAGIEGLMACLKRCTGLGRLRVRGAPAVFTAILLKLAGWNLLQAAKAPAMRELVKKRAQEACARPDSAANAHLDAFTALVDFAKWLRPPCGATGAMG